MPDKMPESNVPFIVFRQLAYVLHDKYNFTKEMLTDLLIDWHELATDVGDDRLTYSDMVQAMIDEDFMPDLLKEIR